MPKEYPSEVSERAVYLVMETALAHQPGTRLRLTGFPPSWSSAVTRRQDQSTRYRAWPPQNWAPG